MNFMLRVLKYAVSNGHVNDIVNAYKKIDLTNININNTDFTIVVSDSNYADLAEVKLALIGSIKDVSPNPETPFQIVRQHKFSINLSPELLASANETGKIYLSETEFNTMLVSHI